MEIDLDSPSVQWVSDASLDPMGRVFTLEGTYYRAIYNEKVAFVDELVRKGVLDVLADNLLVPRQTIEPISHQRFGMLMRSETAKWPVRAVRFPLSALRKAALVWLAINRLLLRHDYGLCDGHYGNFRLFNNSVPKWVDLGSIVPLGNRQMYGVEEFLTQFAYPLLLLSRVPELLTSRNQLLKKGGISRDETRKMLSEAGTQLKPEENALLFASSEIPRENLLKGLRAITIGLTFKWHKTLWSDYRKMGLAHALDEERVYNAEDPRDRTVLELVKRLKPQEVIDMGANKGYHSVMFAAQGFEVLAIDSDEFSVSSCYAWLQDKPHLHVCCSVDSFKRAQHSADTVVSLALSHHLSLRAKMTFDEIAVRYAELAKRHLLVEFMPNGMGGTAPLPNPLPDWYTLEHFLESFSRRFASVRVVDWDGERPAHLGARTLVHCAHPRAI